MKFVDVSANPPKEVEVYTLSNIASKLQSALNMLHSNTLAILAKLNDWVDNPEIDTPTPDFVIGDIKYWYPKKIGMWIKTWEAMVSIEQREAVKALEESTLSRSNVIEYLIDLIAYYEKRNSSSASHNRGNSLRDARHRIVKAEGAIELVNRIHEQSRMTAEQTARLEKALESAKNYANVM